LISAASLDVTTLIAAIAAAAIAATPLRYDIFRR